MQIRSGHKRVMFDSAAKAFPVARSRAEVASSFLMSCTSRRCVHRPVLCETHALPMSKGTLRGQHDYAEHASLRFLVKFQQSILSGPVLRRESKIPCPQ